MTSDELFKMVVDKMGLAAILGPGTLKRALHAVDVNPATATADDFKKALTELEIRLRNYMPPDEARKRVLEIRLLLDR